MFESKLEFKESFFKFVISDLFTMPFKDKRVYLAQHVEIQRFPVYFATALRYQKLLFRINELKLI